MCVCVWGGGGGVSASLCIRESSAGHNLGEGEGVDCSLMCGGGGGREGRGNFLSKAGEVRWVYTLGGGGGGGGWLNMWASGFQVIVRGEGERGGERGEGRWGGEIKK